jgi:hypothetical protein
MVGYDSYAGMLEMRVITQAWISYHRRKGRFTFRRMYAEAEIPNGRSTMIGFEMTTDRSYGRNRFTAQSVPEESWVFRAYLDGTAMYRLNKLKHMLNRRNCFNPINEVINKYFYLDTTVPTPLERDYGNNGEIRLLRRKPLSPYANMMAKRGSLGQYLVNKYNQREVLV